MSPKDFCPYPLSSGGPGGGAFRPGGYRFGLHNLRHSLSSWLVNKGKAEPKTVQSLLRHSRIQTTLDLYTQGDGDETRAAQGAFLREMGLATEMTHDPVNCRRFVERGFFAVARKPLRNMVGATGFEPVTSTV